MEIIKNLSPVLENLYIELRHLGMEIIDNFLSNIPGNLLPKMPNNLIDSLGCILKVDKIPVLKILAHISQRQKFTDKTLSALSDSLISTDDD
jgi:hypothetical protein